MNIKLNVKVQLHNLIMLVIVGMGPSTCSLGARSVLGIFGGARARVLKSEHMLGSLVLGLDARRGLGKHQGITEWYKMV